MELPSYFLRLPAFEVDAAKFDDLLSRTPKGGTIRYDLDVPKWRFLAYACGELGYLAHGSGNPDIEIFEPRKANDISPFGDQQAIYAASDGIWAMYFAIVNRESARLLMNACVRVLDGDSRSEPHYFFSVDMEAPGSSAWRPGVVYLLPRDTFTQQPVESHRGIQIEIAQWASPDPVKPAAKLEVMPEDFPFLEQVLRHDPDAVLARAKADPDGFPWLEE